MAKREEDEAREAVAGMRFAGGAPETAERPVGMDKCTGEIRMREVTRVKLTDGAGGERQVEFDQVDFVGTGEGIKERRRVQRRYARTSGNSSSSPTETPLSVTTRAWKRFRRRGSGTPQEWAMMPTSCTRFCR